jgi:hypothetical protein
MPEVKLLLAVEPELRSGSRQARQAGGHLGANRSGPGENAVERLAGDAKLACGLAHGEAEAGQNLIPQHSPWMDRDLKAGIAGRSHDPAFSPADCSVMGDRPKKARG